MTQATLLRSVSLRDDLAVPARLAHYRPTRRSLPVTRAVLEGDATMVIAAYGSGKSLAAGCHRSRKNPHPWSLKSPHLDN